MPAMRTALLLIAALCLPTAALAHFPWLATDDQGHAILWFGESLTERTYHLPEAVEKASVGLVTKGSAGPAEQTLAVVDEEDFIGRRSAEPLSAETLSGGAELRSTIVYGVYHGSKLTYYTQHDLSLDEGEPNPAGADLYAAISRTDGGGVAVTVVWRDEPLAGAPVQLSCAGGEGPASAETNDAGVATFDADQLKPGLCGVMLGHTVKDAEGEIDGVKFTSASHYLTATFNYDPAAKTAGIPPLPEPIASFGAAVADGWLYVYSGHTGTAHDHSRENLSKHFCRAKLDGSTEWEQLPMGPPLQGLALVAHGGKLYRIGGLDARNAPDEDDDMHSTDSFACFDPATNAWTEMPSLPSGRSSHNAVVMDGRIYVVGGWTLSGDDGGDWQRGAIVFDLADPSSGWQALPEPPLRRRALAVSHVDGKLVALSGMTEDQEITQAISIYDPTTGSWTEGPSFPGKPFYGFGLAAWNESGRLYAGGMEGVLYRLSSDLSEWEKAGEFATARFFHQLLPARHGQLIAVAGASMESGHLDTIERIRIQ